MRLQRWTWTLSSALSIAIGLAMACAPRGRAEAPGTGTSAKAAPAAQAAAAPAPANAPSAAKPAPPPSAVGPRINAIPPKLPPNVSAAPSTEAAAEPEMHRTERRLMGTIWMVGISGGDEKVTKAVSEEALDEVERLEGILSEWKPDSEVSRVNAAAGVAPVKVGPELMACVQTSQETARWSHGAYDISWAALRDLWDFGPDSKETPPTQQAVKARLPLWNYKNIVVDAKKGTIFLRKKGMQIGLGGIAKGYALDRASAIVQQAGFDDFLIFGGGQVLVHGHRGKRLWRVGIQNPRDSSYFGFVDVTDVSVSTSGDYEHSYFHEGKRYHHIIDPKTGFPASKTASVTVIAKTALWADAVDTAAFVMGPVEGKKALAKTPAGAIEGVFVDPELRVSATPGGAKILVLASHLDPDGKIGEPLKPGDPIPKLVPAP